MSRSTSYNVGTDNSAYTHGHTTGGFSPTYHSWAHMIQRCTNPKRTIWARYGGRGIRVCDRWRRFENFLADMGERPPGLTLERNDNDGHYEPGNCRWATRSRQSRNTSITLRVRLAGQDLPLIDACEANGVSIQAVRWARWKWKISPQEAFERVLARGSE